MNSSFYSVITEKTTVFFNTVFGQKIKAYESFQLQEPGSDNWEISGIIGATGSCRGIIAVRLNYSLAEMLLKKSRLNMSEVTQQWQMTNDMIGEIANVIAGNVLSELIIDKFRLSIPVTIQGEGHTISWPDDAEITVFPFIAEEYRFEIQTALICDSMCES